MDWKELSKDLSVQRQVLSIAALSISSLMISFSMGFSSPALPLLEKDPSMRMNYEDASWIASAVPGAALLSILMMGPLVQRVGRKLIMIASSLLLFLSWTGIEHASNIEDLIGYRVLCGIAVGAQVVVGSVYQAEVIHYTLQAKLAMIPMFLGNIGMLLVLGSGQFLDWRGLARLGCYLSIPLFVYFYLPESPYFLVTSKRKNEAVKVLTWLRGDETSAIEELKEQEKHTEEKHVLRVGVTEAFQPPHRWGVCVAILMHIGQQATGIVAITLYPTQVFTILGSSLSPSSCSVIIQLVNFFGMILQLVIVANTRRRRLINLSSMLIITSLLALCVYVCLLNFGKFVGILGDKPNIIFGLFPVLLISIYQIGFTIGWGPVPWLFLVEGLSSSSRSTGTSLAIATNWISTFVAAKSFLFLLENYGILLAFLIYVILTFLFFAISHFSMPETEGVNPKDINQIYLDSYIRTKIVVNSC